ncbi:MAG: hypothetical protein ACFE96_11500 [Candidatus Hermodarchaeota archaeon]
MVEQVKFDKEIIISRENILSQNDIYSGEEVIQFNNRHPIFKTLMKLEFEDVLRNFSHKKT